MHTHACLCIVIITIVSLSFFLSPIGTDTSQYGTLLLIGPHTQTEKLHFEVNGAAVLLLILATHVECIYWTMSCFMVHKWCCALHMYLNHIYGWQLALIIFMVGNWH